MCFCAINYSFFSSSSLSTSTPYIIHHSSSSSFSYVGVLLFAYILYPLFSVHHLLHIILSLIFLLHFRERGRGRGSCEERFNGPVLLLISAHLRPLLSLNHLLHVISSFILFLRVPERHRERERGRGSVRERCKERFNGPESLHVCLYVSCIRSHTHLTSLPLTAYSLLSQRRKPRVSSIPASQHPSALPRLASSPLPHLHLSSLKPLISYCLPPSLSFSLFCLSLSIYIFSVCLFYCYLSPLSPFLLPMFN